MDGAAAALWRATCERIVFQQQHVSYRQIVAHRGTRCAETWWRGGE